MLTEASADHKGVAAYTNLHSRNINKRKKMEFTKLIIAFLSLVCIVLISIVLLDAKFNFSASIMQFSPLQQLDSEETEGNMLGMLNVV